MFMGDAIFQRRKGIRSREAPKRRHCKPHWPLRGALCPPSYLRDDRVSRQRAERGNFDNFRGERRSPVTQWPGHRHTAIVKARVRHNDGKPSIDLVVRPRNPDRTPLGQNGTVRPLRYATHEFAAKAAAVYFAKHRRESSTRLWQARLRARPPRSEWRADREFFKRADTAAGEYIDKIGSASASNSNLGAAMARWIKCAHQNC